MTADFAGEGGFRDEFNDVETAGDFVRAEMDPTKITERIRRGRVPQYHFRLDHLPEMRMCGAVDAGFTHGGMAIQNSFDFFGKYLSPR